MKIRLNGTYETNTYKWSPEAERYLPASMITIPVNVRLKVDENMVLRFSFWKYDAIDEGDDPTKHRKTWADKFCMVDSEPAYREWKDNSGGKWRGLTWVGQYLSWAQRTHEFRISLHDHFCDVAALWPHKRFNYRDASKEMCYESTLLELDEKSFNLLDQYMQEVKLNG